jgi:hypothetical protein
MSGATRNTANKALEPHRPRSNFGLVQSDDIGTEPVLTVLKPPWTDWIKLSGLAPDDFLFASCVHASPHLSTMCSDCGLMGRGNRS